MNNTPDLKIYDEHKKTEAEILEEMALQYRRKEQLLDRTLSSEKQKHYRAYHKLKTDLLNSHYSPMQIDNLFTTIDDMSEYVVHLENLLYVRERVESIVAARQHMARLARWKASAAKDETVRARILKLFKRN